MITILHRGGGTAKRLQYYIGRGGSTETPKSDYVIYGWPLKSTHLRSQNIQLDHFRNLQTTTRQYCYNAFWTAFTPSGHPKGSQTGRFASTQHFILWICERLILQTEKVLGQNWVVKVQLTFKIQTGQRWQKNCVYSGTTSGTML